MLHGEPEERSRLDPAGEPFVTDNLAALVNGIVDPILMIDVHGEVLFVNPAVQNLLGYEPVEVVGHRVSKLDSML